jgi:hypothetical protein
MTGIEIEVYKQGTGLVETVRLPGVPRVGETIHINRETGYAWGRQYVRNSYVVESVSWTTADSPEECGTVFLTTREVVDA